MQRSAEQQGAGWGRGSGKTGVPGVRGRLRKRGSGLLPSQDYLQPSLYGFFFFPKEESHKFYKLLASRVGICFNRDKNNFWRKIHGKIASVRQVVPTCYAQRTCAVTGGWTGCRIGRQLCPPLWASSWAVNEGVGTGHGFSTFVTRVPS